MSSVFTFTSFLFCELCHTPNADCRCAAAHGCCGVRERVTYEVAVSHEKINTDWSHHVPFGEGWPAKTPAKPGLFKPEQSIFNSCISSLGSRVWRGNRDKGEKWPNKSRREEGPWEWDTSFRSLIKHRSTGLKSLASKLILFLTGRNYGSSVTEETESRTVFIYPGGNTFGQSNCLNDTLQLCRNPTNRCSCIKR